MHVYCIEKISACAMYQIYAQHNSTTHIIQEYE